MCFIKYVLRIPLRMSEDELLAGDDAIHGEAAYVFAGELGMGGAVVGHEPHAIAPVAGERTSGNGSGSHEIKHD
jgi:Amt family ammonium transporter